MLRLPKRIRCILANEKYELINITHLLTFYRDNKHLLSTRQKRVIYRHIEKIRQFYNQARIEKKTIFKNGQERVVDVVYQGINLQINEITPDDIYKDEDNFRQPTRIEHYYTKLVNFFLDFGNQGLLRKA